MADDSFEPRQYRDRPRNRRGRSKRGFTYRRKDQQSPPPEYSYDQDDEVPRRNDAYQQREHGRGRGRGRGRNRGRGSRPRQRRGRGQNRFYDEDDNVPYSRESYGRRSRGGHQRNGRGRGRGKFRNDEDNAEDFVAESSSSLNRFRRSANSFGSRAVETSEEPPPPAEFASRSSSYFNDTSAPNNDNDLEFVTLESVKPSERKKYLINSIRRKRYDCGICQDKIVRRRPIWSCQTCYNVFHLDCINTWAIMAETRAAEGAGRVPRPLEEIHEMRCPICRHEYTDFEPKYFCYCGKFQNPYDDRRNLPHSCGTPCDKSRGRFCSHPCQDECHPGPCDPCTRISDRLGTCPCGKQSFQMPCSQDEVESSQVCGQVCEKRLDCGNHRCTKKCHTGPCETCELVEMQTCFCGKHTREAKCGSGQRIEQPDGSIVFSFSCENVCDKPLACGNHTCTMTCHSGSCSSCRRKIETPSRCACGKSVIEDAPERTSCLDPLPECEEKCDRMLSCGKHFCEERCHDSPCPMCKVKVRKKCRCGKDRIRFDCEAYTRLENKQQEEQDDGKIAENPVRCKRMCKQIKSCGVHQCGQRCCPGTRIQNYLGHMCDIICNKPLACGQHRCLSRCHLGPCRPCDVILRRGIRCACGTEWIPGPVPCGTAAPECYNPCPQMLECGHPCQERCHLGACGRCTVRVPKACHAHQVYMDVPCFVERISCGQMCKLPLSCGKHLCTRSCHAGPCDEKRKRGESCGQTCGEVLPCGHKCREKCHPNQPCPTENCNHSVVISCICGNRREQERCHGRDSGSIAAIPCNDSCKIAERNRQFREAFGIDDERNEAHREAVEYSSDMLKSCQKVVENRPGFLKEIETILRDFVMGRPLSTHKNAIVAGTVLDLQCPHPDERFVIFSILPHYHMTGETLRVCGKTSMAIRKNERSLVPSVKLSEALVRFRQNPDSVFTLESAPPRQMLVIDHIRDLDDSKIQDKLGAWEGHYRMWRSRKGDQLFVVFMTEELRNSALAELRHYGARGAEVQDSAEAATSKKRNQKSKRKKREKVSRQPESTTNESVGSGWTKPKRTADSTAPTHSVERIDILF